MVRFYAERHVFRRGDNVLEYWVDHAEGFEVRRGARGRVESVVVDPHDGRAKKLVVRSAHLDRRLVIPVEAVVAVDPFARRLEVARTGPPAAARASRSVARVVAAVAAGVAAVVAWSAPRLGRTALAGGASIRRFVLALAAAWAWLVPRARNATGAALALAFEYASRLGAALALLARTTRAWLGPRLTAWRRRTATNASAWGRAFAVKLIAGIYVFVLALLAAVAWATARLRESALPHRGT